MARILDIEVELPVATIGGKIKSISVNGIEQPIVDGNVDIAVPTKTSDLNNDSNFVKESELAQVAKSGDYNDLENTPDIPSTEGLASETYVNNSISEHNTSSQSHSDIRNSISTINGKIPEQASTSNQLADKNFVNSSVANNTAYFLATLDIIDDLHLTYDDTMLQVVAALNSYSFASVKTNNDYCNVITQDNVGNILFERFKWNSQEETFKYEFSLNNSSFTAVQWASINSNATAENIAQIALNALAITTLQSDVSGKVSKSGDTMTGELNIGKNAIAITGSGNNQAKFKNSGGFFGFITTANGTAWYDEFKLFYALDKAMFRRNNIYTGNTEDEAHRLLRHSEIDTPTISTSITLVGGITHLNVLGSIDYATIALPTNPGTAEYNGTFTSTTSGDITVSLPLTFWDGDTDIVSGKSYSFSIQNGVGFIIQLN